MGSNFRAAFTVSWPFTLQLYLSSGGFLFVSLLVGLDCREKERLFNIFIFEWKGASGSEILAVQRRNSEFSH